MNEKILVISNACFSPTDSNGRTLAKYFTGTEPKKLAQFYVRGLPDFKVCENYYRVSDENALRSFLKMHEEGSTVTSTDRKGDGDTRPFCNKSRKTPLKMLIREFVWKYGRWNGPRLKNWIEEMSPTFIVLFLADNAFLPDFARKIAQRRKIPIVAYSTEDYYFKTYNYITRRNSLFYFLLHKKVQKAYQRCADYIKEGIFNTPELAECYAEKFSFPCKCIFARSDIDYIQNYEVPHSDQIVVSYLGNLGLNRHIALMEIADCLQETVPGARLCVYGRITEKITEDFSSHPSISYKGFVGYEEVVRIIHDSTLLVHAEFSDGYNNKDLRYAFSTKIADSICSGTPFLIYADGSLAETRFLIRTRCAFVATKREQLARELRAALTDAGRRRAVVENAAYVRKQYFNCSDRAIESLIMRVEDESPAD